MKLKRRNRTSKLEEIVKAKGALFQTLEEAARDMINGNRRRPNSFAITNSIEQEIAFTLEQINREKALQKSQLKSLLRAECHTGTELKQMEERIPWHAHQRFSERHKFQQRLFTIDAERRKSSISHEERIQSLQKKLLSLMQKHEQLSIG